MRGLGQARICWETAGTQDKLPWVTYMGTHFVEVFHLLLTVTEVTLSYGLIHSSPSWTHAHWPYATVAHVLPSPGPSDSS